MLKEHQPKYRRAQYKYLAEGGVEAKILAMWDQGFSNQEITDEVGSYSRGAMDKWIRELVEERKQQQQMPKEAEQNAS